jgi:hypothetical protein
VNIDALSGRELDAAVAREVFGLKAEPRTNARTHETDYVYEVHPGQWVRVALYSERMGPHSTASSPCMIAGGSGRPPTGEQSAMFVWCSSTPMA